MWHTWNRREFITDKKSETLGTDGSLKLKCFLKKQDINMDWIHVVQDRG
jgi:hypothetical protein